MVKEVKIENIILSLSSDGVDVRIKSDNENVILINQSVDNVSELIRYNFKKVSGHYKLMINESKDRLDVKDISHVSIAIVLYFLFMYNSWRIMYKKLENKDLKFIEKDFSHPSTHDIIFKHFKTKYLNDWEEKCAVLLGKEVAELKSYYKTREEFYNK